MRWAHALGSIACVLTPTMLLLTACSCASVGSGDAGAPDAGGFDPSRIELGDFERDFCAPWARVLCERAERCGCGAAVPGGVLDVEGCVSRKTADCVRTNAPSLEAGAVTDVRAAHACVTEIERQPECGRHDIPATCGAILFFPIPTGAECTAPVPGFCAGDYGVCFPGSTCRRRSREGEPCLLGLCAPGLFCADDTSLCVPLGEEGAPCRSANECDPALRCLGPLLAGTCLAPVAEGGACAATSECATGLECTDGACAPAGGSGCRCGASRGCLPTASACAPRRAAGEPCGETRECAAELACGVEGVCVARPIEGESCDLVYAPCGPGLGCQLDGGFTGTCVPAPGEGEPCGPLGDDSQLVCADELACVIAAGSLCATPLTEGAACSLEDCAAALRCVDGVCGAGSGEGTSCEPSDSTCAEGLYCYQEACRAAFEDGAHCDSFRPCVHECLPDATGGGTCASAPERGDPCESHEQCGDDLACLEGERACVAEICDEL